MNKELKHNMKQLLCNNTKCIDFVKSLNKSRRKSPSLTEKVVKAGK